MRIYLNILLDFYDRAVLGSEKHATALNAVLGEDLGAALMQHYFEAEGFGVEFREPCTQGTQRGVRLDKWLAVSRQHERTVYQVEIKNWSAHSIGGETLRPDAALAEYGRQRWKKRFITDQLANTHVPSEKSSNKVLTPMRVPDEFANGYDHKALICFWEPMHPSGEALPIFTVRTESKEFDELTVFSMSTYVRSLLNQGMTLLELEMPNASARIDWLEKISA